MNWSLSKGADQSAHDHADPWQLANQLISIEYGRACMHDRPRARLCRNGQIAHQASAISTRRLNSASTFGKY